MWGLCFEFINFYFFVEMCGARGWPHVLFYTLLFSRTESRILGALSQLDGFFLNPQLLTRSGIVPGTFRNKTWKTRNQMRIVAKMILILEWDPPFLSPVLQLMQTQTRFRTTIQDNLTFPFRICSE